MGGVPQRRPDTSGLRRVAAAPPHRPLDAHTPWLAACVSRSKNRKRARAARARHRDGAANLAGDAKVAEDDGDAQHAEDPNLAALYELLPVKALAI